MNIVVTGASGFIGSEIVRHYLSQPEVNRIYVVVRAVGNQSGRVRFDSVINHWRKHLTLDEALLARITVVEADILGNPATLARHIPDSDYFFHCAATTDIGLPLVPARAINLIGTQKAVQLARKLPSLKRFVHFSTAYVLGSRQGVVRESDLPLAFNNGYEQSKYEAEQVLRYGGVPYTIVRPSLVVGDSQTGYVRGYKVIYAACRAWLTNALPRAPLDSQAFVDTVPVDYVVRAVMRLAALPAAEGHIYHLTSGSRSGRSVEILRYAMDVFGLCTPKLAHPWLASFFVSPMVRPFIGHRLRQIVELMQALLPYLGTRNRFFANDKVDALLAPYGLICPDLDFYGQTMFKFCRDTHWGKRPIGKALANV